MPRRHLLGSILALGLFVSTPASANAILGELTVDNVYTVYLSTAPNVLGTPLLSDGDWGSTEAFGPTALTPGQNYWLQVVATDQGPPGAFLGEFALTGGFKFINGLQTIETNTTNWLLQSGSLAGAPLAIADLGANGVGPWGTRPLIAATTHWIWDAAGCGNCTLYFSTPIIANRVTPPVPEPALLALLGSGALALVRRRVRGRRV